MRNIRSTPKHILNTVKSGQRFVNIVIFRVFTLQSQRQTVHIVTVLTDDFKVAKETFAVVPLRFRVPVSLYIYSFSRSFYRACATQYNECMVVVIVV